MIVLSNTTAQTLQPGQAITFDKLVSSSGCGESARSGGPVNLNACCGVYEIMFGANVTGATAAEPVELSIAIGGAPLLGTSMIYTPAAANAIGNVSKGTYVKTGRGLSNNVTVINSGANPIIVSEDASLAIKREG